MAKKSFVLYNNYEHLFSHLSDKESGMLIKGIFQYETTGNIPNLPRVANMAFLTIKDALDSNREKYADICEKRSEAGKKGGRPSSKNTDEGNKKANAFSEKQTKAKKADTDADTDTDTDTDADTDSLKERESTPSHAHEKEKKTYGEFLNVFLTDEEYEKLTKEYTNDTALKAVNLLSTRIARDKNSKYKDENHYATIKDWVITAVMEHKDRESKLGTSQKKSSPLDGYKLEDFFEIP